MTRKQRPLLLIFSIVLFSIFLLSGGKASPDSNKKSLVPLTVKGKTIWVEVVKTEEDKTKGLMFRDDLGRDEGMLFVYDREEILTFWMKNTPLPLSIAFLDSRGKVVDLQDMTPFSIKTHASAYPARYALEMNQGWFKRNGVSVGDTIKIPK